MPETHEYRVNVNWSGGREGSGDVKAAASGTAVALAVPTEFGGKGGGSNPEELLTEAIASCYSITFGIIAANRKLPVETIQVEAVGEVESQGPNLTYKRVVIKPQIQLSKEATDDQLKMADDMAHKADSYCPITNAVRGKVEVTVEPQIQRAS